MHQDVANIFRDAGASDDEIAQIDQLILAAATETRAVVTATSSLVRDELQMPLRILLCRVIHADMEKAFMAYRTTGEQSCGGQSQQSS